MPRPTPLASLAVAGLVLSLLAAPARAQTWEHAEPGHDAVGYGPTDPETCESEEIHDEHTSAFEIRSLRATWGAKAIRFTVRLEDLRQTDFQFVTLDLHSDAGKFEIIGYRDPRQGPHVDMNVEPDYPDPDDVEGCGFAIFVQDVPCPALAISFRPQAEVVRFALPPSCLGDPHWVRVGGSTSGQVGETFYADDWAPVGTERDDFVGPFGPQVRPSVPVSEPVRGTTIGRLRHRTASFVVGSGRPVRVS